MKHLLTVLFATLMLIGSVQANTKNVYPFDSRAEEQRFQTLTSELRCPKCQNQNIADSNAPISKDMRDAVYRMMNDGASDEEITNELVSRFGEFVRYKPEVDKRTFVLWATPALVVFIGVVIVLLTVSRSRRADDEERPLSETERARAASLLNENERKDDLS